MAMKITEVTGGTVSAAGAIHAESWRESHRSFCSPEFVAKHTAQAQTEYLRQEMAHGKRVFLLEDGQPVGIVSVQGNLIENLYVLPTQQNRGYGTRLLKFAMAQCDGAPALWILNNNEGARRLYIRHGFQETGKCKPLGENLWEIELGWSRLAEIRQAEKASHEQAYSQNRLFEGGSWLAKPVKSVMEWLPLFAGRKTFRALDLGCGVGRNSIPVAQAFRDIPCRVDCVDILPVAIQKLQENAAEYGVQDAIRGILSGIDSYEIQADAYDLILAVSALEHMDSEAAMVRKLEAIRDGIRSGGGVCLVMNTGVREWDTETGAALVPQFEVNMETGALQARLEQIFAGWTVRKSTVVHQRYAIPRESGLAELETDVVTFSARKK